MTWHGTISVTIRIRLTPELASIVARESFARNQRPGSVLRDRLMQAVRTIPPWQGQELLEVGRATDCAINAPLRRNAIAEKYGAQSRAESGILLQLLLAELYRREGLLPARMSPEQAILARRLFFKASAVLPQLIAVRRYGQQHCDVPTVQQGLTEPAPDQSLEDLLEQLEP